MSSIERRLAALAERRTGIKFDLEGIHPDYIDPVTSLIEALAAKYPWSGLREVRLFQGGPDDHSEGNVDRPRVMSLNRFWLSQPPAVLQEATLEGFMRIINGRWVPWHVCAEEPLHLIVHEFGHVVSDLIPSYETWSNASWIAATTNLLNAPSAYACANLDEFWAEAFTAVEIGVAEPSLVDSVNKLLADHL